MGVTWGRFICWWILNNSKKWFVIIFGVYIRIRYENLVIWQKIKNNPSFDTPPLRCIDFPGLFYFILEIVFNCRTTAAVFCYL